MILDRRRLLTGGMTLTALAVTGCGVLGQIRPSSSSAADAYPAPKDVIDALRKLADQTGRDAFRSVVVFPTFVNATVLNTDGSTTDYQWQKGWSKQDTHERDILSSRFASRIAELPLGKLPDYVKLVAPENPRYIEFHVDHVGKLWVGAGVDSVPDNPRGLAVDASRKIADMDPANAGQVNAAIRETIAGFGTNAIKLGSFNGFVYVDLYYVGNPKPWRVIRYPTLASFASSPADEVPEKMIFNPSGFDSTLAIDRKQDIVQDAKLDGQVWDWTFQRPPKGGAPMLSYGIGPDSPATRVWVDDQGKIKHIVKTDCKPGSGWCPG